MPGLVGLITDMPRECAEPQLQRMLHTLCHQPFYAKGTWIDERLGVYVGWVAHENSFSDQMPLLSERSDVTLLFSGEEYPAPGTVYSLRQRHTIKQTSPAAYLVHLYEEDRSFPAGLNGRFHGLLADRNRQTVLLFNDRYGMHRVYCHQSNEAFYFAAEAKAILAVRSELREPDSRSLGEFISCGCALENRTLFQNIFLLPPGSAWTFRKGSLDKKNQYFHENEWEQQERVPLEMFYCELRDVFARNLPRYFNGQQPVGMSLTGGLDTRMIMAWHKGDPGSLPCYTFGGPYHDCQDVMLARKIAQLAHQPHQVISLGKEFLSQFAHYAERAVYLSDGTVQVERASDLYANELARKVAPVRITGNYGSEVLRWCPAFRPGSIARNLYRQEFLFHVDAANDTYRTLVQGHPASFAVFRQGPWFHYGLLGLEQTQLAVRSPYLDNDFVRTIFRAPCAGFSKRDTANVDLCLRLIGDGDPILRGLRTDRGLGGNGNWSSKTTRHLLEFTFKAEYAYDYGMPQWVSRVDHALSFMHFEKLFLGRHKFAHYRVWYRDALANYVRAILLDPLTLSRPYLNGKELKTIVSGHLERGLNYTTEIHQLLTLELIQRLFFDSQPAPEPTGSQITSQCLPAWQQRSS